MVSAQISHCNPFLTILIFTERLSAPLILIFNLLLLVFLKSENHPQISSQVPGVLFKKKKKQANRHLILWVFTNAQPFPDKCKVSLLVMTWEPVHRLAAWLAWIYRQCGKKPVVGREQKDSNNTHMVSACLKKTRRERQWVPGLWSASASPKHKGLSHHCGVRKLVSLKLKTKWKT